MKNDGRKVIKRTEIWFSCCTWGCEFDLNTSDISVSNKGFIKSLLAILKAKYLVYRHKKKCPTHDPYLDIWEFSENGQKKLRKVTT